MNSTLKTLMARSFDCSPDQVTSNATLSQLGAKKWQIIEMAMEFEDVFGVPMDADKALSLKKVSDWEKLI